MADGDPVADQTRDTGVGVDHRQVLDVGRFADRDPVRVAAQHRVVPDARIPADPDVAQNDGSVSDVSSRDRSSNLGRTPRSLQVSDRQVMIADRPRKYRLGRRTISETDCGMIRRSDFTRATLDVLALR